MVVGKAFHYECAVNDGIDNFPRCALACVDSIDIFAIPMTKQEDTGGAGDTHVTG